jgi:pyruvate formate lyase activating enzyme
VLNAHIEPTVTTMTDTATWAPAILAEPVADSIVCGLCPHRCALADGETGLCRVRRRNGPILETATLAAAVHHVDPIERKPLYHFRPGTATITLAAPGCTFLCSYCINYRLSQYGRPAGQPWSAEPVDVPTIARHAADLDAAIALSYTEPALAIELTLALTEAAAPLGVPVIWKTNGFLTPEAAAVAAPAIAAANIDIKAPDEDSHRRLTGGALGPVLDTAARLHAAGVWVEISTPLIPGVSDESADLVQIARMIADIDTAIPWHLLRFTPTFRMTKHSPTRPDQLAAAVRIGQDAGLHHVYVERALGPAGRATRCPGCHDTVIARGIWSTESNRLSNGSCPTCATPIHGRW